MMNRSISPYGLGSIRAVAIGVVACLLAMGCTAPLDGSERADDSVTAGESALTNAYNAGEPDYNGLVALQVFNTLQNDWFTFCTGTLSNNTWIITAAHCLPAVQNRVVYARMGWQRVLVSKRIASSSTDIAVLKMSGPMWMWNWSYDHYLTSPSQLTQTDYHRPFFTDSNYSLNNRTLACYGHGGVPNQPPETVATFTAKFPTGWMARSVQAVGLIATSNFAGSVTENGDSGGPCTTGFSVGDPVAAVMASGDYAGEFFGTGGGDWSYWAAVTMLGN